jgi:protocatechuate 3,4-dioxygenase, beta subunit
MNKRGGIFSRRKMLEMTAGVSGLVVTGAFGAVFAQEAKRLLTPPVTRGPFYPAMKPLDQDADLTILAGNKDRARGKIVHLTGRVLNSTGQPVSGAKIELWQANTHGRYSHPRDSNRAPLDPNFQGFGVQTTDAEGRYRFKTIKPGPYPNDPSWMRPPHLHFDVSGKIDRVVTQMFFPGEPLNEKDRIFQDLRSGKEAATASAQPLTKELEADSLLLLWDIVLDKG